MKWIENEYFPSYPLYILKFETAPGVISSPIDNMIVRTY